MKILIVDNDPSVAEALQTLFSNYHYAVDVATTGETGLDMADAFDYDLILLDVLLPGVDGISVCQQLRARGFKMPILLLTAQDESHQKATALNEGADDYVVKPFDSEELIARVQALMRRGETQTQPILAWGQLAIDPHNFSVTYCGSPLSLTPKEYSILELFLRHPRQVFTVQGILDRVWPSAESPGEESVRVHIKGLRKKFTAIGAPKNLIETLPRLGYRLNPAYTAVTTSPTDESPTASQLAELSSTNDMLETQVMTPNSAQAELSQQNQVLEVAQPLTKQEQQQLQSRNQELEQQVVELTAALAETKYQLQQRNQELQLEVQVQPVRELIRELSNMFTPILATIQLLNLTQKGLDAITQERLRWLEENTNRGAVLVKEIRTLIGSITDEI